MSFGGPGGSQGGFRPTPPDRGSFPLDHDGECTVFMTRYMDCIKQTRGKERLNEDCRILARDYLKCRMDTGLMAKDDWVNLGLPNEKEKPSRTD
ncbi:hypothetical protein V1514DRAFT_325873, partial [Lipomyces japonicus]|uniref:uncharacterized protein n=1 Tax=Lipomyces japonicus TaxID=56871 RepID=UPI0034CE970F